MDDARITPIIIYNQLIKEMDKLYHDYAQKSGLPDTAFWILYSIEEGTRAYTQKEICDAWSYSRQTINSALKNLEKQGYIRLIPQPNNRKNKQIFLTQTGNDFSQKVIIPLIEAEKRTFALLGDDLSEFLRLSQKHMTLLRTEVNGLLRGEQ